MKREKTILRQNAVQAKSRLGSGFWNAPRFRADLANINDPGGEDEQFYRRVSGILDTGEQNPLQEILDREYMMSLSDTDRQRYVLNMSFRVAKSVERYNKVC